MCVSNYTLCFIGKLFNVFTKLEKVAQKYKFFPFLSAVDVNRPPMVVVARRGFIPFYSWVSFLIPGTMRGPILRGTFPVLFATTTPTPSGYLF